MDGLKGMITIMRLSALLMCVLACAVLKAQEGTIMPSKKAKKEAKILKKAGWRTVETGLSMEEQIEWGFQLQNILLENEEGKPVNRYILVSSAEERDRNIETAKTKARIYCETFIAQALQTAVKSLIEHEIVTRQTSATNAETEDVIHRRVVAESKANLRKCIVVRHLMRRNADGTTSIQLVLAFDKTQLTIN